MNSATLNAGRRLPAPLRMLSGRVPRHQATVAFTAALNLTLLRKLPVELMTRIEGERFAIVVEDADVELRFRVDRGRFRPDSGDAEPLVRFHACAWDYAALAARLADPDTLFFHRRLLVEGDTEVALLLKNTLDTVDIPVTRAVLRAILRTLQAQRR